MGMWGQGTRWGQWVGLGMFAFNSLGVSGVGSAYSNVYPASRKPRVWD